MAVDPFAGIDMEDPCAVWPVLEKALYKLMMGAAVAKVSFGEDETQFTTSDKAMLERTVSRLKNECAAKTNGRPVRRAFRAGFRW